MLYVFNQERHSWNVYGCHGFQCSPSLFCIIFHSVLNVRIENIYYNIFFARKLTILIVLIQNLSSGIDHDRHRLPTVDAKHRSKAHQILY